MLSPCCNLNLTLLAAVCTCRKFQRFLEAYEKQIMEEQQQLEAERKVARKEAADAAKTKLAGEGTCCLVIDMELG